LRKFVDVNSGLPQDCFERPFRHIAGMVRNGRVSIGVWIEPDLVAYRSLSVELEAADFQLPRDFSILEACQTTHLGRDYDGVVLAALDGWQVGHFLALAAGFDELARHIPSDFQRFPDGAPLCNQPREFVGDREVQAFWQLFYLDTDC
jgi:hypothetical protein